MSTTITLLNAVSATGMGTACTVVDRESIAGRVTPMQRGRRYTGLETVVIQSRFSGGTGTVKIKVSTDYGVSSPATWDPVQVIATDGTHADLAITGSGIFAIQMVPGAHFVADVTTVGSPLPTITMKAMGDINTAA